MKHTACYHLPGLFEFYELYRLFLPLFREHREYFYDWCDIGSIYGAPADCIWGGGRVGGGEHDPHEVLALLGEYGISARLTFSTLPETSDIATLRTFTTLCAMMNKQALTQQRIQAKEASAENEKYAMRIWLLRLGMNGPEYKDERRFLMANLSGNCAFRTEEDKERWQLRQNEKRDALKALKQEAEVNDDADAE